MLFVRTSKHDNELEPASQSLIIIARERAETCTQELSNKIRQERKASTIAGDRFFLYTPMPVPMPMQLDKSLGHTTDQEGHQDAV